MITNWLYYDSYLYSNEHRRMNPLALERWVNDKKLKIVLNGDIPTVEDCGNINGLNTVRVGKLGGIRIPNLLDEAIGNIKKQVPEGSKIVSIDLKHEMVHGSGIINLNLTYKI